MIRKINVGHPTGGLECLTHKFVLDTISNKTPTEVRMDCEMFFKNCILRLT